MSSLVPRPRSRVMSEKALAVGISSLPSRRMGGLADQVFDDLGTGCRGAEAAAGHGSAQLLVIDHLAGAFHRGEQCGFVEACGRLGDQRLDEDLVGGDLLARLDGHQPPAHRLRPRSPRRPCHTRQPARIDQHLPSVLKASALDTGDTGGDAVLGRRVEHRQEAPGDQIVDLASASDRLLGAVPVGTIAKWSEILALLKMRLFGLTQPCLTIWLAKGA